MILWQWILQLDTLSVVYYYHIVVVLSFVNYYQISCCPLFIVFEFVVVAVQLPKTSMNGRFRCVGKVAAEQNYDDKRSTQQFIGENYESVWSDGGYKFILTFDYNTAPTQGNAIMYILRAIRTLYSDDSTGQIIRRHRTHSILLGCPLKHRQLEHTATAQFTVCCQTDTLCSIIATRNW